MPIVVAVLVIAFASACIVDPVSMSYSPASPYDAGKNGEESDIYTPDTQIADVVTTDTKAPSDTSDTGPILDATDVVDETEVGDAPIADVEIADVEEDIPDTGPPSPPTSCADLLRTAPDTASGVYTIFPVEGVEVDVFCDMVTDGGVGYTMVRIDAPDALIGDQNIYRATCEALGMEVIVPKTRAHARSITSYNSGRTPNLVNVFPKTNGARGLENWEARCQGQPCAFYLSDTNNSNCTGGFEPSGDNSIDHALYSWRDETTDVDGRYCFGGWNDEFNKVDYRGFVICSTNDTVRRVRESCQEYLHYDEVYNRGPNGISGTYLIEGADGSREEDCTF